VITGNPSEYWYHLYVSGGSFLVAGRDSTVAPVEIRDASDVGLERLRPLVENIVLAK
jgi:hypothetical protein